MALAALMVGAIAAPASATGSSHPPSGGGDGKFSCSASALRVTLLGNVLLEPVVANPNNVPCVDDNASLLELVSPLGLPLEASVLSASTDARANGGSAESSVAQAAIGPVGAPLPVELPLITAEVLSSSADVTCENGKPVFSSDGTVARLTVGGVEIEIPDNGAPFTLNLGVAQLYLNRVISTPTSITRRALQLTVPGLADVVIAESIADVHGKPCQKKPPKKPECSDGKDNDHDKKIDKKDPGCYGPKGYNPNDNSEKH